MPGKEIIKMPLLDIGDFSQFALTDMNYLIMVQ